MDINQPNDNLSQLKFNGNEKESQDKEKKEIVPKNDDILGKGSENSIIAKQQEKKIKEYQDFAKTLKTIKDNILYHIVTLSDEKLMKCIEKISQDGFSQFFKAFMFDYYYKIKCNNNLKLLILTNMEKLENMIYADLNNVLLANSINFNGIYNKHDKTEINAINLLRKMQEETVYAISNIEFEKGPIAKQPTVGELKDEIRKKFRDEYEKL